MSTRAHSRWILLACSMVLAASWVPPRRPLSPLSVGGPTRGRIHADYRRISLDFEQNAGQTDPAVKFLARGTGYAVFLTPTETVFRLKSPSAEQEPAVVRMAFVGANKAPVVDGLEPLAAKSNYFAGNDPAKWQTNVGHFSKVRYRDIYRGIDVVYYGKGSQLEYDMIVAPAADPTEIVLRVGGDASIGLSGSGDLTIRTAHGELVQHRPVIYQDIDGDRRVIGGRYVQRGADLVALDLDAYDPGHALIIDPVLSYSTFLGGLEYDEPSAVAVGVDGSVYIAGVTYSPDFPTTPGALHNETSQGSTFVTRIDPNTSTLIYSTFLRSNSYLDSLPDLAVDASGNAYLAGHTESADFPTTRHALQRVLAGRSDVFVTKLNESGSALVYSTLLGGSDVDGAGGIAVDAAGGAYVGGWTHSFDFPVTATAIQPRVTGRADGFLVRLNATGTALDYSTFFGGNDFDGVEDVALASDGGVFITGNTNSSRFPVTNGASQRSLMGATDVFVARFGSSAELLYSTLLGGSDYEFGSRIAVDLANNAYIAGDTSSPDFPTTPGAFQRVIGGFGDAFLTKLNPSGSALVYSTLLGGSQSEFAGGLVVNGLGQVTIVGNTHSTDFPTAAAIFDGRRGFTDAFVTRVNALGSGVIFSTFLGGSEVDEAVGIAADGRGGVLVAGSTYSMDFPTTPDAFQPAMRTRDGFPTREAFLALITESDLAPPAALRVNSIVGNSVTLQWTAPLSTLRATEYSIEGGLSPGEVLATLATGTASTNFSFTAPSGIFYVRVHAVAPGLKSGPSNEIRLIVGVESPPSPPTNLLAYASGSLVGLAWMNTLNGGAPSSHILDVSGTVNTSIALAAAESVTFLSVPDGTYTVSMRSANNHGVSGSSNSVTLTLPAFCSGVPRQPTAVSASVTLPPSRLLTVTWNLPLQGPAPEAFTLDIIGPSFSFSSVRTTNRSYSFVASPGTYSIRVLGSNRCGPGLHADPATVVVP